MKLKISLLAFLVLIVTRVSSQDKGLLVIEDFKKPIDVKLTGVPEIDDKLKFAFDKYWKFGQKRYFSKGYKDREMRYENTEAIGNFHQTSISFIYDKTNDCNSHLNMSFDDLRKRKNPIGLDDSLNDNKDRIIQYIMIMCRNIEVIPTHDCAQTEAPLTTVTTSKKLSEYNKVIITKETIIKSGVSEETIKKYLPNYIVKKKTEVTNDLVNDKIEANTAQLLITHIQNYIICTIMDLKTGDVIAANFLKYLNSTKKIDAERFEQLLTELKK